MVSRYISALVKFLHNSSSTKVPSLYFNIYRYTNFDIENNLNTLLFRLELTRKLLKLN